MTVALVFVISLGVLVGAEPAAATVETAAPHDPHLTRLLLTMRRGGFLDDREAALENVETILQQAQDAYVRGDALGSAILLFELTHNPRYETLRSLPIGSAIDYHLGVALHSYGAVMTARDAFRRVMAKGPADDYFGPSLRRHVDIALEGKDYVRGVEELDQALAPSGGLSAVAAADLDEYEYLRARALQQRGDFRAAVSAYEKVGPTSRFHTAALYLRGVVHATAGQLRAAEHAFCQVIGGPHQSTAAYYVDQRYFDVRDLAHLGLGRVAHEELRHEHAFYHYFQVPQDSDHVPSALFEAAWTMAEAGEYAVARDLIRELQERFPDAPQAVEARLLAALLQLYDCDFRTAEDQFTRFVDDLVPVLNSIERVRQEPATLRAMHAELAALRAGKRDSDRDSEAHQLLLTLLDENPRYARLSRDARILRNEARFAQALHRELRRMGEQVRGDTTATHRDPQGDALEVFEQVQRLEQAWAGLSRQIREAEAAGASTQAVDSLRAEAAALHARIQALEARSRDAILVGPLPGTAQGADLLALLEDDAARMLDLRARSLRLAARIDDQAVSVAAMQLGELKRHINGLLGEARMGRIDAVLGAKKKLEIEVRDMAAGRFPPELFGKLQIEGMVTDAEEFWPYEGEYWADEYEGFR